MPRFPQEVFVAGSWPPTFPRVLRAPRGCFVPDTASFPATASNQRDSFSSPAATHSPRADAKRLDESQRTGKLAKPYANLGKEISRARRIHARKTEACKSHQQGAH